MLLHDVIMTSYCCQRYAEFLVTTLFQQVHVQQLNCSVKKRHFLASNLWSPNSHVNYAIWAVMQHRVYHRQIHSVDELKRRLINVWCGIEQSIFDETIDQWRGRYRACVYAKEGHFEYSL